MIEIKMVCAAGQGAVWAAKFLVSTAVKAGYHAHSFAWYGTAIRGGQVESYVRIAESPILVHSKIYQPDYLILLDESFVKVAPQMIKPGTAVLINTPKPASAFSSLKDGNIITFDANRIAAEKGLALSSGTPIINTTILGAICGLLPSIEIDHLAEALREGKVPRVERNIEAARETYNRMKQASRAPEVARAAVAEAVPVAAGHFPQYRNRLSPCEASCPAGEIIERTAYFIEHGHFEDALESIKAENPFPGICGRVCFHPCEDSCNRIQYDEGIACNALERAAFDYADASLVRKPEKRPATGKRVAVIGSGPAGLTGAYYLARLGHSVTVFEAQPVAGGVPRFGIPEYHLPKRIVDQEIAEVSDLGIDIKLNTKVGKDIAFDTITKEYDACFIASGAHRSMKLGIPGEDSSGVYSGLDFLKRVTLGEKVPIGKKVVVVGGGNVAMDVARTAKRMKATEVHAVCLESREEMPAYSWEIAGAEAEGIDIRPGWGPRRIITDNGKVTAIEFDKCVAVFDSEGRFSPTYDKSTSFRMDGNTVITAIGETLELPFPDGTLKMSGRVIEVDELGRTSMAGVYAGGDATSLSRSVVEAIAAGKRAALGIDLYLARTNQKIAALFRKGKNGAISMGRYLAGEPKGESSDVVAYEELNLMHFTEAPRVAMAELAAKTRLRDFAEAKLGFTKEDAIAEAERCFHCGHCTLCEICYISCPDIAISLDSNGLTYTFDKDVCKSCGICIYECPRQAISWEGVAQ